MIYNLFILSVVIGFIYYFMKSSKSIHMLQQNWYNDDKRYLKWIKNNYEKAFYEQNVFIYIIFILSIFFNYLITLTLFLIGLLSYISSYKNNIKKEQVKKPLAITKRVKRLFITTSLIYLIPTIIICFKYKEEHIPYYLTLILILIILIYFIVLIANIINKPIEKQVFKHYYKQARNKIKNMNNLKVVGITGSYGKTSSKNILNDILNIKFNSFPSPKNYNTTNGLMLTINNHLDKFNDIFIAEMGAFKIGEIKELCDLVQPKYGVLTKIGTAHLETFKSEENIQKGKFELIESLPSDGLAILNKDDEKQVSYKLKNKVKTMWIAIDNKDADVIATNIKQLHTGMSFDCIFKGDKNKYHFETKLLGKANIYNILAGIALGHHLQISIDQLIQGVKKVRPVEHRLELKKYNDITIIDDAYNSNPVGSKMALEVLELMPGKKIIVTPGMIDLGQKQDELNQIFGEQIAEVCDEVILVGAEQTKPIYQGLMNKKYKENKIHIINDVKIAFTLMQELKTKDTYVLLENDLPDIFNEK